MSYPMTGEGSKYDFNQFSGEGQSVESRLSRFDHAARCAISSRDFLVYLNSSAQLFRF